MIRKTALTVLTVAPPLALAAMLWNDPRAPWLLAAAAAALPTGLMLLGVRTRRAAGWVAATGAILLAGLGTLLATGSGAVHATTRSVMGSLIVLAAIWLVPLVLVSVGFALTFNAGEETSGTKSTGGREGARSS